MKIYIKRLGCPKNDVDGDYIAGKLMETGHEIVGSVDEAKAVIINTCGFILPAREESVNEIVHYEKLKNEGKIEKLFITGCMSQRYGHELIRELDNVDGIFGLGKINDLAEKIDSSERNSPVISIDSAEELRYISGNKRYVDKKLPYDYIKIADGCDRYCAYCAIPHIRGRYRSRPISEILIEAEMLAKEGKKEIILVSQEGTGYGRDLGKNTEIIKLLKKLESIRNIEWIRLMYLHPEALTDELIDYMTNSEKVLGYFDIPLQHISDNILRRMNRRINRAEIEKKLNKIRKASEENVIRTTFITGFPGETEEEFDELQEFIENFHFDRMGVFKYSPEEETPAFDMKDRVPDKIAEERQDILMLRQQEIVFKKNIALIESVQKVIIDDVKPNKLALGRTKGDCPEIDQIVYVRGGCPNTGDIISAKVVMAEGYDLITEVIAERT
jgi:ribosomal protein S12 methylthiotransferase